MWIKENGEIAALLDINIGFFDLKERKLLRPENEWLAILGFEAP